MSNTGRAMHESHHDLLLSFASGRRSCSANNPARNKPKVLGYWQESMANTPLGESLVVDDLSGYRGEARGPTGGRPASVLMATDPRLHALSASHAAAMISRRPTLGDSLFRGTAASGSATEARYSAFPTRPKHPGGEGSPFSACSSHRALLESPISDGCSRTAVDCEVDGAELGDLDCPDLSSLECIKEYSPIPGLPFSLTVTRSPAGSLSECGCPSLTGGSISELDTVDVDAYSLSVDVNGAEDDEEELIRAAWTLLRLNTDLLRWVQCWIFGDRSDDCIVNRLSRAWFRVDVRFRDHGEGSCDDEDQNMYAIPGLFGGTIYVCRHDHWERTLQVWTHGRDEGVKNLYFCAVIETACMLFHELIHICYASEDWVDGDFLDKCYDTYLSENLLMWALHNKYPAASHSRCCSGLDGCDLLYSDGAKQLSSACIDTGDY